ncbi:MAG: hypothetical protein ACHREM_32165 [Polyangiales bacterium]
MSEMEAQLRTEIRRALLATQRAPLAAFADAVTLPVGDRLHCWGDLAQILASTMRADEDWIALARVLIDTRDSRALLLLFDLVRGREGVVRALLDEADRLNPAQQRALVVLALPATLASEARSKLGASARELLDADERVRARDVDLFRAHAQVLRAQRATSLPTSSTSRNPQVPEANVSGGSS